MNSTRKSDRSRGFTLVELLVVIAIIGVLIALLLPAVQAAREAARRLHCTNNLKQLALGVQSYHDGYGCFPYGALDSHQMSWRVSILPYIEQQNLHEQFNFRLTSLAGSTNLAVALTPVNDFFCPSATNLLSIYTGGQVNGVQTYTAHYFGVAGAEGIDPAGTTYESDPTTNPSIYGYVGRNGVLTLNETITISDISDGTAATFLLGEIAHDEPGIYGYAGGTGRAIGGGDGQPWVSGTTGNRPTLACKSIEIGINMPGVATSQIAFASYHPGGASFAKCDGSVSFVDEDVDMAVYKATASRDHEETDVIK
ncbi:MAG TPA: prepilin-type cleavage/methylation domain-containing protein [Planctomycetaceae bacterium]|nr:prepilin-type cleavage/methylation domain-containing protein [Planctomycetaceae bacterium]